VIKGGLGDTDAPGSAMGLQPRRNVHAVTVKAVSSSITSPRLMPMRNCILRDCGNPGYGLELLLHRTAALHRIHHAGEFARRLSPGEPTIRPRCCWIRSDMTFCTSPGSAGLLPHHPHEAAVPTASALRMAASLRLKSCGHDIASYRPLGRQGALNHLSLKHSPTMWNC